MKLSVLSKRHALRTMCAAIVPGSFKEVLLVQDREPLKKQPNYEQEIGKVPELLDDKIKAVQLEIKRLKGMQDARCAMAS